MRVQTGSEDLGRPRVLRIGDLLVDTGIREVRRAGEVIHLPRLSFRLLLCLARHAPNVVSLDRMIDEVWSGTVVNEDTVLKRVKLLRDALGDDSADPRYVALVRGHGYRLLSAVEPVEPTEAPVEPGSSRAGPTGEPATPVPFSGRRLALAAGLLVLALLAVFAVWRPERAPRESIGGEPWPTLTTVRIGILPLEASVAEVERFAAGMTDQLLVALADSRFVTVTLGPAGAGSTEPADLARLGHELAVDALLTGRVERSGNALRVTLKIFDPQTAECLWAQTYDRPPDQPLKRQSEIARAAAEHLELVVQEVYPYRWASRATENQEAYRLFARGRDLFLRYRHEENEGAIELFEQALELDPDFNLARAWLANAYVMRTVSFREPEEWIRRATETATQVLEVEPRIAKAHNAIGLASMYLGHYEEAARAFERVRKLEPMQMVALHNLAAVASRKGRWDEVLALAHKVRTSENPRMISGVCWGLISLELFEEAREWARLALEAAPHEPLVHSSLAYVDVANGDFLAAKTRLQELAEINPRYPPAKIFAGEIALFEGDLEEARAELGETAVRFPDEVEALFLLAAVDWLRGERPAAEALFDQVREKDDRDLARGSEAWGIAWRRAAFHALHGDVEAAVDWYARAVARGHRRYRLDRIHPVFAALWDDPRFQERSAWMEAETARMRRRVVDNGWCRVDP